MTFPEPCNNANLITESSKKAKTMYTLSCFLDTAGTSHGMTNRVFPIHVIKPGHFAAIITNQIYYMHDLTPLPREFFARDTNIVSTELLGKILYFHGKTAIITEMESYIGQDDPACHAARGCTKRTDIMFGLAGFSYVYLIYGMYYCLNFVTETEGFPAAALIRGLHVTFPENRHLNGPGKLCKYLGINISHNKCDLINNNEFFVSDSKFKFPFTTTPRIGISKGTDKLWRYVVTDPIDLL